MNLARDFYGRLKNPKIDLKFSTVNDTPLISHLGHEQVHALLFRSLASLETVDYVDKIFRSAIAIGFNLLKRGLK
jgi:hypothetical protein